MNKEREGKYLMEVYRNGEFCGYANYTSSGLFDSEALTLDPDKAFCVDDECRMHKYCAEENRNLADLDVETFPVKYEWASERNLRDAWIGVTDRTRDKFLVQVCVPFGFHLVGIEDLGRPVVMPRPVFLRHSKNRLSKLVYFDEHPTLFNTLEYAMKCATQYVSACPNPCVSINISTVQEFAKREEDY